MSRETYLVSQKCNVAGIFASKWFRKNNLLLLLRIAMTGSFKTCSYLLCRIVLQILSIRSYEKQKKDVTFRYSKCF